MKKHVPALISGALFGVGLLLSGMTRPAKVIAFLDVGGAWDPSLALVMIGAIGVFAIGYRLIAPRGRAIGGGPLYLPTKTCIDRSLVVGAAVFGVGWGLGGYCPGPAIVSAAGAAAPALVFVAAMVVGMLLARRVQ
jgi:uncharacterized membrane protein YedE/YeeE